MNESIIFLSSALQQPRHQKRISLLREKYDVKVYYFYRDKYIENYKGYQNTAINIGEVKDGKYISRIFLLLKLFLILLFSKVSRVYCTSPDQAIISILAGKKVFFEIGDLYQVDGRNKIYKMFDYFIFSRISGLIVTSPYYYSGYLIKYEKFLKNKIIVVENKLLPNIETTINHYRVNNHAMNLSSSSKIKIGLIGSLMFKKSLEKIREFIIKDKNFELHIYGDGLYGMFSDIDNVFYHGRFKSPEDLSDIYSNIDINVILYDTTNNNVKLALPNKLYESIAFLKPIICSDNVALSEIVFRDGIGEVATNDDLASAIYKIISNYDFYIHNMKLLDSSRYICFEQSEIFELINRAE
ncbi:MAG: hypothetical protein BGN93_11545 [Acinetobacter sp. 39-4]|nr:MAG: hypothetical protein BGN93_11545 [Acinetobacter sp. 39-4]